MATTASDLVDGTLDFLLGSHDDNVNTLTTGISTSDTTLTFDYDLDRIAPGATLCIGLEVMRVMAISATAKTATVLRAQRGTTAATASAGAVVQVNPRFSKWSVFNAINDELDALSGAGLFQMKTVEVTYNIAQEAYDLTSVSSVEQIYSVRYQIPGSSKAWPLLLPSKYRFERNANTTDFASGFSIDIFGGAYNGYKLRIAYKDAFTRFTALSDDAQSAAGLPSTANDLPRLGAAIRLTYGHESGRLSVVEQPARRADEVPVGGHIQTAAGWERLRTRRINEELARLARRYPIRKG